jgi:hypothetical protein
LQDYALLVRGGSPRVLPRADNPPDPPGEAP